MKVCVEYLGVDVPCACVERRVIPHKATKKRKAEELEVDEKGADNKEEGDGKEGDGKEEPPAGPTSEKLRTKV